VYLLYAPVEKFGNLAPKTALISDEVLFTHNIAYCPKFFWKKYHLLQGIRDITPNWMKRKRESRVLSNILIIATGGMGDSMWAMPFVKALRGKYPRARILIATEERNMFLWQGVPYADSCVKDEFWNLQSLIRTADEVFDFGGIATFMKKEMRMDPIEAIFSIAEMPTPKEKKACRPHLVITVDEGKAAEAILRKKGIDTKKDKIICIGLNSSTPNRDWPFEYAKELTAQFIHDGYKVVWLSDKPDFNRKDENEINDLEGVANLAGQISIRQSMAILALSNLYIGPNSALMVISTALEIPTVGLFGAFSPKTRTKFYEKFTAVSGKYKCAPCGEHWTECPEGHPAACMKNLAPTYVYAAAIELLRKHPRTIFEKRPIE
jgi:ADP-heptose:LPS heptosyltransferase